MNYYELLEVSPKASQEVIKAAYKSLMQRYHPDRNPGNLEAAQHAARVVQAYEVLSDLERRAAYDNQLNLETLSQFNNSGSAKRVFYSSAVSRNRDATKEGSSYWTVWLIITLIILSSWLVISLAKNKSAPDAELKEIRLSIESNQLTQKQLQIKVKRMDEILREHPDLHKRESAEKIYIPNIGVSDATARTIPIYLEQLTVHLRLPDSAAGFPAVLAKDTARVLSIPVLGVKVGSFDSDKVMRHIDKERDFISLKLTEDLANARFDELVKIHGEQYLKNIILDSIGASTGTNRNEVFPSSSVESPGRYGVIEVSLPEYFTVR